MLVEVFALLVAIFTMVTGRFDIYCLAMAAPGSTHNGYFIISYEFVYVGNGHATDRKVACSNHVGVTNVGYFESNHTDFMLTAGTSKNTLFRRQRH